MIKIIDYGMGNCGSIQNMLRYLGAESEIISEPQKLTNASAIILPGVGSFDNGMSRLEAFRPILHELVVVNKVPFLGICLGMQLLLEGSNEGSRPGLGWIPGSSKRFDVKKLGALNRMVVPHMGWNEVNVKNGESIIGKVDDTCRFYFVHSYHAAGVPPEYIDGLCNYGYDFICSVKRDNILGVQFHPEKSHKFGKRLFQNFIELSKCYE